MRIRLYMDVWPGMRPEDAYASASPGKKLDGWTRYAIDFSIPDPNKPDVEAVVNAVSEQRGCGPGK